MQNWNGCSNLVRYDQGGSVIELTDIRDNNNYNIAKLKDGRCWMIQNLRLGDDKLLNRTLTSEDTNIPSGTFTLPIGSVSGFTTSASDAINFYVDDSVYGNHGVVGNFYTWKTATAGTGLGSMTTQRASASICPKGWRLPTGNNSGEQAIMGNQYGSTPREIYTNLQATPVPNFGLFGWYANSTHVNLGSTTCWFSSDSYNTTYAYGMTLWSGSTVQFNDDIYKGYGHLVRCIAE